MPTTKREALYFGLMMCLGMVVCMTTYNLLMHDMIGKIGFADMIIQYLAGFVVAMTLEMFIVGPLAKKVAFKLPINKAKKLQVVLAISSCMVIGMVFFMSLFGLVMSHLASGSGEGSLLMNYLSTFVQNFIVAYPLQLLVMGPLVRRCFSKFVQVRTAS
ncbi:MULTISPECIES: DUF2798 domain-containing protein [Paenibacillus]|uniref:DUF2798 domain-containing protein n=1 Tax=Paenibacillus TaxID=44249 RepID=UPI002FE23F3A